MAALLLKECATFAIAGDPGRMGQRTWHQRSCGGIDAAA
jgi:hypothetical protein